jgi:hypothetical protein
MRQFALFLLLVGVFLIAGCIPERVVWSPDGTRALVIGDDGLHVCDADGKLSPQLLASVRRAAWLPDGRRAVVVRAVTYATWAEIEKAWPDLVVAPAVADRIRAALIASKGSWDGFEASVYKQRGQSLTEDQVTLALIYLRDMDKALPAQIGDAWQLLAALSYSPEVTQVYEIGAGALNAGPVLLHGPHGATTELRVAPGGKFVAMMLTAYSGKSEASKASFVVVSKAEPRKDDDVLVLPGGGNAFVDWTPDGRSVVYMRPFGPTANAVDIATLRRQPVTGEDGALVASDAKLAAAEDLAGLVFNVQSRVRVAADGRIFFSAMPVTLPASPTDLPTKATLFMVHPGRQATVQRVVPRSAEDAVGDAVQYFELSPDGQRVALPSDDGRVAVLTIGSGEVLQVQPTAFQGDNRLVSLPTWRSGTELTFVRPAAAGGREVVRYDVAGANQPAVVLSGTWDEATKHDWLDQPPAPGALP